MLVLNVVPLPTEPLLVILAICKVAPAPTCISLALVNIINPLSSSDATVTEVPAPIVKVADTLKISLPPVAGSLEIALPNPLIPVRSAPSPTNLVAVIIPVELIL